MSGPGTSGEGERSPGGPGILAALGTALVVLGVAGGHRTLDGDGSLGFGLAVLILLGTAIAGVGIAIWMVGDGPTAGGLPEGSRSGPRKALIVAVLFAPLALALSGNTTSGSGIEWQGVGVAAAATLIAGACATLLVGPERVRRSADPALAPQPAWPRLASRGLTVSAYAAAGAAVAGTAAYLASKAGINVMVDDAPITLRYVERLATGDGFTYNDHEHVLGASNPLYALVVTCVRLLGASALNAAAAVCLVSFAGSTVLAGYIAARLSHPLAGVVAGVALALEPHFRAMSLSGMESSFAVLLALGTVVALLHGRETLAGVLIGLAVWNKIDAGLLAMALAAAFLIAERRFPTRIAVTAAVVVAPWAVFATAYYGSPIPHSLTAKVEHTELGVEEGVDPLWIVDFLGGNQRHLWIAAAIGLVVLSPRLAPRHRIVVLVLAGWGLLHGIAYSVIDLGAPYPWYLTALVPPAIILGVSSAFALPRLRPVWLGRALAAVALVLVALAFRSAVTDTTERIDNGNPVEASEAFDSARRLAGMFVDRHSDGEEIVSNPYGWSSFEYRGPINDHTRLSSEEFIAPERYYISHGAPATTLYTPPGAPPGFIQLADFVLSENLAPGWSWLTVWGRADSQIARSGKRALQERIHELGRPLPYSAAHGLRGVEITTPSLQGPATSGAVFTVRTGRQPVRILFEPQLTGSEPGASVDFEVHSSKVLAGRVTMRAGSRPGIQVIEIAGAEAEDSISLGLVTRPRGRVAGADERAIWGDVRVAIGDADVDLGEIEKGKVRRVWEDYNPHWRTP